MNQSGIPANSAPVIASSRPPAVPVLGDREQTISPRGFSDALDTAAMRGDFDKGLACRFIYLFVLPDALVVTGLQKLLPIHRLLIATSTIWALSWR